MSIVDLKNSEKAIVVSINAGIRLFNRLASMGICEGIQITVIKNNGDGPVVIDVDGAKFAIGRGMAEKISVNRT